MSVPNDRRHKLPRHRPCPTVTPGKDVPRALGRWRLLASIPLAHQWLQADSAHADRGFFVRTGVESDLHSGSVTALAWNIGMPRK